MVKFNERSPYIENLHKDFKEIPERGAELSDKVDGIVVEIQNIKDVKKKQKKLEELLKHIHPLLDREVSEFCKQYSGLLLKQGFTKEDVFNRAVELMIENVYKWDNQETRKLQGKTSAHFITFFFSKVILYRNLGSIFVRPALTGKRKGNEISLNQPKFARGGEVGGFARKALLQDSLTDKKTEEFILDAIKKEELMMGKDAILEKLYTDEDPFLSLVIILRLGFGADLLNKWKEKFDLSVKSGKIEKHNQKYIPNVSGIIEKHSDDENVLREVGDLIGFSRERARQKEIQALKILKEQLESDSKLEEQRSA